MPGSASPGHWPKGEVSGDWGCCCPWLSPVGAAAATPLHTPLIWLVAGRACALSSAVQCQWRGEYSHSCLAFVQTSLTFSEPRARHEWVLNVAGRSFRHALFISVGVIRLSCAYAPCLPFGWLLLPASEHPPNGHVWTDATETCRSYILYQRGLWKLLTCLYGFLSWIQSSFWEAIWVAPLGSSKGQSQEHLSTECLGAWACMGDCSGHGLQ